MHVRHRAAGRKKKRADRPALKPAWDQGADFRRKIFQVKKRGNDLHKTASSLAQPRTARETIPKPNKRHDIRIIPVCMQNVKRSAPFVPHPAAAARQNPLPQPVPRAILTPQMFLTWEGYNAPD